MSCSKEEAIQSAIRDYLLGRFPSVRRAAGAYNVAHSTLSDRLNGALPKASTPPSNRALTLIEEEVVYQKILDLDLRGYSPTQAIIRSWASSITKARTGREVGQRWAHNFVKRHSGLETRLLRRLSNQRAKNEDPEVITEWFTLVQNMIAFYGITEHDIYNFDESGFRLGHCQNTMVVTATERRQRPRALVSDSTQWQTVIACVNAEGWSVPPYIIFSSKEMNRAWFKHLPPN